MSDKWNIYNNTVSWNFLSDDQKTAFKEYNGTLKYWSFAKGEWLYVSSRCNMISPSRVFQAEESPEKSRAVVARSVIHFHFNELKNIVDKMCRVNILKIDESKLDEVDDKIVKCWHQLRDVYDLCVRLED